jgi:uncharacterized protein (TIGR02246 family)
MEMRGSVTSLVRDLVSAWNRGDATAFASLFTAEADYVTGAGVSLHGQQAIAELLRTSTAPPRVQIEGEIVVRDYGAAGSAIFRWVTEAGTEPHRRGVVTCVVVKTDAAWLIDRLHNTDEA